MPLKTAQLPLVSILVPLHGDAPSFRASILSCLAQRYSSVEIIVVDNCSGEISIDAVREFEPFVRIARVPKRISPGMERNVGMSHASGEFVLFHDIGDVEFPDRLWHDVEAAYRAHADIVISLNRWLFDGDPHVDSAEPICRRERRLLKHITNIAGGHEESLISLLQYGGPQPACMLYRTSMVRALGGYNDFCEPHAGRELLFRAVCRGAVVAVNPRVTSARRMYEPPTPLKSGTANGDQLDRLTLAKQYAAALREAGLLRCAPIRQALTEHVMDRVYDYAKGHRNSEIADAALTLFSALREGDRRTYPVDTDAIGVAAHLMSFVSPRYYL